MPETSTRIGLAWAGPIPAAWRVARVRMIARLYSGGTPDRENLSYWEDGTVPWLSSGEVNQWTIRIPSTYITEEAFRNSSAKWIPRGSLVIALAGQGKTKGMVAQLDIASTCNQSMAAMVPSSRVEPRFLLWWLDCHYETIRNLAGGELRDGLNLDVVGDIPCPLPPLSTQRSIADYLDRETARIDALIAAKRRMVELLEERFRVARIDLVTGRDSHQRQVGPAWLGTVPSSWVVSRLKFVAEMDSGHTPNKQVDAYWVDCTIPWITLNDVSDLEADWRFNEPKNAVNELGLQNSSAHVLPANAVTMSRDATVGRSALLGRPMAVSQHFVAWICGPEMMPEYLLNVIRGPMQHHFGSLTAGATIATIGMPDLNQLVVPVPPLDVQGSIVREIAAAEKRSSAMVGVVRRQLILLQERRQALITAAVTGQLDIPDAA